MRLLEQHQGEVLGYLTVLLRHEDDAYEVFSRIAEDVLRGWEAFRHDCAPTTWLYAITRNAALAHLKRPWPRREVPLSKHPAISEVPAPVRTHTEPRYRSAERKVDWLRSHLSEPDQSLLTLRLDRGMEWRDIVLVLNPQCHPGELDRESARLRKRFERLKQEMAALARKHGLFDDA